MNFPDYIEMKFLEWQKNMGKRKNVEEFAAYIGVSQATLSQWMNGKRTPGGENIKLLAEIFGNEVYDIFDLPRPNPYLQIVNRVWEFIPEEVQKKFSEEAEKYETKNELSRVQKVRKRKKTRKVE